MFAQAVRSVNSISESIKTVSFATHKVSLLKGLVLVATCGMGTALSSPAQAASFAGFGCSDNPSCQQYFEVQNAYIGESFPLVLAPGPQYSWSLLPTRTSSPILYDAGSSSDPGIPLGPRHAIDSSYSLLNASGSTSASLNTVLELGRLKGVAKATAEASAGEGSMGMVANAGVGTDIGWGDTITVTSDAHSLGESVPFELRLNLDRSLRASGKYGGNSQAYVRAALLVYYSGSSIFDSNFYPSNVTTMTQTVYLPVGESIPIEGSLSLGVSAEAFASFPNHPSELDISNADAFHTANYYLTPLLSDVSYTSASGKTYFYSDNATPVPIPEPTVLPGLLIGLGLGLWRRMRSLG
jgi:hypothetical protein